MWLKSETLTEMVRSKVVLKKLGGGGAGAAAGRHTMMDVPETASFWLVEMQQSSSAGDS